MKTETCKLHSRVFWIFLPNVIKLILIILSNNVLNLVQFFWDTVYSHYYWIELTCVALIVRRPSGSSRGWVCCIELARSQSQLSAQQWSYHGPPADSAPAPPRLCCAMLAVSASCHIISCASEIDRSRCAIDGQYASVITILTLWPPLLPYGWAIQHPVPDRVKPVICNFWHPGTLTLRAERQSARMSKITNDDLTRSDTRCFIAVPIWQQWGSKN